MPYDENAWKYENRGKSALICHAESHWRATDAAITFFPGPDDAVEADEVLLGVKCRKQCSGVHSVVIKDATGRVRVRPSVHNPQPEAAGSQLGRERVRHESALELEDALREQQERNAAAVVAAAAREEGTRAPRGVYRSRGAWAGCVYYDRQRFYLGTFPTVEEAADAVRRKRVELGQDEEDE